MPYHLTDQIPTDGSPLVVGLSISTCSDDASAELVFATLAAAWAWLDSHHELILNAAATPTPLVIRGADVRASLYRPLGDPAATPLRYDSPAAVTVRGSLAK